MYEITFEIPGLPNMTNAVSRNWYMVNKERTVWKNLTWVAVKDHLPKAPLKKAKLVCIRHSVIAADYDGIVSGFKSVIDGLVEAGVIEDDNLNVIGIPEFGWKKAPRGEGKISVSVFEV